MTNNVKKLLDTAYNELGYLEKATNNNLDSKTENAGSANYTKYARDCFPELQGMAWCCMFVWWCFNKTFNNAYRLIGDKTAKCSIMKQRMLEIGCERASNVKEGDIVFFDRGTGISHTGIVYSIGDTYFSTIEGNTSRSTDRSTIDKVVPNGGGVFIRAYNYKNIQINDFVRPRYDLLDNSEITEPIIKNNAEISAYNVNIRAGAGTHCKWIGQETKGYRFNKIGETRDPSGRLWYRFIYKGQVAYVCGEYVKLDD